MFFKDFDRKYLYLNAKDIQNTIISRTAQMDASKFMIKLLPFFLDKKY